MIWKDVFRSYCHSFFGVTLCLSCVNSYQRTEMNLRGLSCWMLPSQPRFTLRLLPCDQRALTADPPRRCVHLLHLPRALYRPRMCRGTISCLVWSTEQTPACVGGSLLFGWPLSSSGCRMRWRSCLRLRLKIIKQNKGMHNGVCFSDARRAEGVLGSIFVSCRDHPWIPCAAARTGINTQLHRSVDAPS